MIRTITATQLLPGMYIHELHCSWVQNPFMRNQFLLEDAGDIRKIREAGIKRISIDTDQGIDIPETPEATATETTATAEKKSPAKAPASNIELRIGKAKALVMGASSIVKDIMADVRAGEQVDMSASDKVVSSIIHTLSRDPHTLLGVARLKTKDEYTFMHSVSVAALLRPLVKHFAQIALDRVLPARRGKGRIARLCKPFPQRSRRDSRPARWVNNFDQRPNLLCQLPGFHPRGG